LPVADEVVPSLQVVGPPAVVVAAGVVAAGAAAGAEAAGVVDVEEAFCTPPWPLHAPLPVADEVVPSLQVVAPPVVAVAAGAAAGAGAAGVVDVEAAFWTPPWPLHAPLPVALEVVPSLHVVGAAVSAAWVGSAIANANSGAAMTLNKDALSMEYPRFELSANEL
jgi:hypothetical protein